MQFNYDPGNVRYYTGAVPEEDIEFALPRLGHFHLKDQRGGKGVADFPPLGEGEVDIPRILRRLRETGFSGPVCMEIEFTDYEWPAWEDCVEAAPTQQGVLGWAWHLTCRRSGPRPCSSASRRAP